MSDETKPRPYTEAEIWTEIWFGGQRERVLATAEEVKRLTACLTQVRASLAEVLESHREHRCQLSTQATP
jgi:hypothetical protein